MKKEMNWKNRKRNSPIKKFFDDFRKKQGRIFIRVNVNKNLKNNRTIRKINTVSVACLFVSTVFLGMLLIGSEITATVNIDNYDERIKIDSGSKSVFQDMHRFLVSDHYKYNIQPVFEKTYDFISHFDPTPGQWLSNIGSYIIHGTAVIEQVSELNNNGWNTWDTSWDNTWGNTWSNTWDNTWNTWDYNDYNFNTNYLDTYSYNNYGYNSYSIGGFP